MVASDTDKSCFGKKANANSEDLISNINTCQVLLRRVYF